MRPRTGDADLLLELAESSYFQTPFMTVEAGLWQI